MSEPIAIGERARPRARRRARDQSDGNAYAAEKQRGGRHEPESRPRRRGSRQTVSWLTRDHERRAEARSRSACRRAGSTRRRAGRPFARPAGAAAGGDAPPASLAAPSAERLLSGCLEHARERVGERLERAPDPPARAVGLRDLVRDRADLDRRARPRARRRAGRAKPSIPSTRTSVAPPTAALVPIGSESASGNAPRTAARSRASGSTRSTTGISAAMSQ